MSDKTEGIYREDILDFAEKQYHTEPEYPWRRYPNYAVLRHADNQKWYAVIMDVPKEKLGLQGKEKVNILNVKCDPMMSGFFTSENGILPAYHMNKENWISVLLDGSVDKELVFALLRQSYELTGSKQKVVQNRRKTSVGWKK